MTKKQQQYGLFIDTTQEYCVLALVSNKKVVAIIKQYAMGSIADILVNSIKKLLSKNKVKKEQINNLYLIIGPGSFTGSRMGYLVAMAWITTYKDVNLHVCDSLRFNVVKEYGIGLIDAKSQKSYLAVFDAKQPIKPCLINNNELEKIFKKYQHLTIYDVYPKNVKQQTERILKYMSKVKEPKSLTPLYIKEPI